MVPGVLCTLHIHSLCEVRACTGRSSAQIRVSGGQLARPRWPSAMEKLRSDFSKVQQSSARFSEVQQGSARFTRERDRKDEEIEEIEEIVILLSSCSNITRVVQQVSAERLSVELANPGSPDKSFQQKRLEAVNREFNKGSSHEFLLQLSLLLHFHGFPLACRAN